MSKFKLIPVTLAVGIGAGCATPKPAPTPKPTGAPLEQTVEGYLAQVKAEAESAPPGFMGEHYAEKYARLNAYLELVSDEDEQGKINAVFGTEFWSLRRRLARLEAMESNSQ